MKPGKYPLVIILCLLAILSVSSLGLAQSQPVFRIGVLDNERGPISNGARLAVQRLNDSGGVRGADGSFFRLELVIQPTNFGVNLEEAVNNLNQANIIAALGPETDSEVLNGLPLLQSLNVPVITPAQDDTIIISDSSGRIFRSRAAQILSGQALASYLLRDLETTDITAVQLDIDSTDKIVGFVSAAGALGVNPQRLILQGEMDDLVTSVISSDPTVVVAYGSPALASEFYNDLRNGGWTGRFAYDQVSDPTFQEAVPFVQLSGILSTVTWPFTAVDAISSDFLTSYVRAYGEVPGEIEAASYDSVMLLAEAIGLPGDLISNLSQLENIAGVQGVLNPAQLARGETSNNVAIVRLGTLGAPQVVGR
ncbi:MAG: ABC transporter substrate-binding protein, partial [Anaerolineae bacterium]|nr:ABC transporter substrate-binding protein [Anaerolineae bacterium]